MNKIVTNTKETYNAIDFLSPITVIAKLSRTFNKKGDSRRLSTKDVFLRKLPIKVVLLTST